MKLHNVLKVISGLTLLASILLFTDYYLPQHKQIVVLNHTDISIETDRGYRLQTTGTYYRGYGHANNMRIAQANFSCLRLATGDTLLVASSAIYHLQIHIEALSGHYKGARCYAENNPFALKGLFILIPILFSIVSIRSNDLLSCILLTAIGLITFAGLVFAPYLL